MKSKSVLQNIVLSLIAYVVPTIALTFVVQPAMSRLVGAESYGLFLTIISVVRLVVATWAASLANLRLLENENYRERKTKGDFNLLLLFSLLVGNALVLGICFWYNPAGTALDFVLTGVVFSLIMLHDYLSVAYRVNLQFSKHAADNAVLTVGFFLGLLVFHHIRYWQVVFICGYGLAMVFVLLTSDLWREPFRRTERFKGAFVKHQQLSASMALTSSVSYCDKLVVYPILGGNAVSVYNAAAVVGKAIQLISVPMQSVLLSYIVKFKELPAKKVWQAVSAVAALLALGYGAVLLASDILIPIMYPDYYMEAKGYVWIVLLAVAINTLAGLMNALVMRFRGAEKQVVLSAIRLGLYLVVTFALIGKLGLMAMCIGLLCSAIGDLIYVTVLLIKSAHNGVIVKETH